MREIGIRPEIEIFDLSHIHGARRLINKGPIDERPHVQFVMGVRNALPADERLLDILLDESRRILPQTTWTAAGIGANQAQVMEWVLARGGDGVRTGLEDSIRISKDRLASGNAELVKRAVDAISRHDARPATPQEARVPSISIPSTECPLARRRERTSAWPAALRQKPPVANALSSGLEEPLTDHGLPSPL